MLSGAAEHAGLLILSSCAQQRPMLRSPALPALTTTVLIGQTSGDTSGLLMSCIVSDLPAAPLAGTHKLKSGEQYQRTHLPTCVNDEDCHLQGLQQVTPDGGVQPAGSSHLRSRD